MSRLDRLKQYADPMRGPHGAASSKENIQDWVDRAHENSKCAPRSRDGEVKLPNTGKAMVERDTAMKPREARKADARMVAKQDTNFVGDSPYMRGVRRDA
jgi:hypothetical protein